MSPWLTLIPATVILCGGSWLTYQRDYKPLWWFLPTLAALGAVYCVVWGMASKLSRSDRELYSISTVFDLLSIVAYTVLPLVLCGVRLSPVAWCGVGCVVVGVGLITWGK